MARPGKVIFYGARQIFSLSAIAKPTVTGHQQCRSDKRQDEPDFSQKIPPFLGEVVGGEQTVVNDVSASPIHPECDNQIPAEIDTTPDCPPHQPARGGPASRSVDGNRKLAILSLIRQSSRRNRQIRRFLPPWRLYRLPTF